MDDQALGGGARLTVHQHAAAQCLRDDEVEIGVIHDDGGAVAPELEVQRAQQVGGRSSNRDAGSDASRKGHGVDTRRLTECGADVAAPGEDGQDAGGQTGIDQCLRRGDGGQGILGRRLQHDCVAGGERSPGLFDREFDREIERDDAHDDPERHTFDDREVTFSTG